MAKTLDEMIKKRPVDRQAVDAHKRRMLNEVRAYKLRELREEAELTQVQVAEQLQITQNRVSQIEKGELTRTQVDTLQRYVEALGGQLRIQVDLGDESFQIV